MPFADALAGTATYDAGRVLVDFTLAYNPYCAYKDSWSCPITPREHRLAVAIRAGGQRYPDTQH